MHLLKREGVAPLGESRSLAIQMFTCLQQSLWSKGKFDEFTDTIQQYLEQGHANPFEGPRETMQGYFLSAHACYRQDVEHKYANMCGVGWIGNIKIWSILK